MNIFKSILVGSSLWGAVTFLLVSAAAIETMGYRIFAAVAIPFILWVIGDTFLTAIKNQQMGGR